MNKINAQYFINLALEKNRNKQKPTLVVVCPYDIYTIDSIYECYKLNLINVVFVGDQKIIQEKIKELNINFTQYELYDENDPINAVQKAMELLSKNKANMLMKGLIDTSILLKALLNKEYDLRKEKIMTHVCLSFNESYDRYFIISDAAMVIKPNLEQKKAIIENAVWFAHRLGIVEPKVALLCAKEKPYEKMPDTLDAQQLQKMNENGKITNCVVSGPLQIDLAIDHQSAVIKGCKDPVAGCANILICPNIESANILSKGLSYLGGWSFVGLIIGAKVPFILTSRSTLKRDRIVSIALACLCI